MKVKLLNSQARPMTVATEMSAGMDMYACIEGAGFVNIPAGECVLVPTGLAIEIEPGTFGALYPRSGVSTKRGLRLANCVGVIDADYRGEVKVPLYNDSKVDQVVFDGEKIAQLIITPYERVDILVVNELSDTERGSGGFGSTDGGSANAK